MQTQKVFTYLPWFGDVGAEADALPASAQALMATGWTITSHSVGIAPQNDWNRSYPIIVVSVVLTPPSTPPYTGDTSATLDKETGP